MGDTCTFTICFALDGSAKISELEFESQKNFSLDSAFILSEVSNIEVSAVQFGSEASTVRTLTSDVIEFDLDLFDVPKVGGATSNRAAGIRQCSAELVAGRQGNMNIVVFGDGRNRSGSNAVRLANQFRNLGGNVFAVNVNNANQNGLLDIVEGDENRLFAIDMFLDILNLEAEICGFIP